MPPKKAMIFSDSERQMLVPDLIRLILDSLDFTAFHKARSISLDWYSTAELCIRQTPTPWLILFPNYNNGSCKLFDPCERKSYSVANLGFDFTRSRCLASCGSWFLMLDHRTNFHLLNLFTREMIPLPSLETIQGPHIRFERIGDSDFVVTSSYEASGKLVFTKGPYINIKIAILWVDERSRDYFVVWNMNRIFGYHKKGDSSKSWKVFQPLKNRDYCVDMVFKDHKLYMLCDSRKIDVFDFSCGYSPKECASFPTPNWYHPEYTENLAVTLPGEVLYISSRLRTSVLIYKLDPTSLKWGKVYSLGNDTLVLDLGTTIATKDGFTKNCIYFSNDQFYRRNGLSLRNNEKNVCMYDIETKKVIQEFEHLTASLKRSIPCKDGRWFCPTFGGKWLL